MNKEFNKMLASALREVTFISETDAPMELVSDDKKIRVMTFTEFFKPLIRFTRHLTQDEAEAVKKMLRVRNLMLSNMTHRRVVKVARGDGEGVEFDIYIVGRDSSGSEVIIETFAVET